jgi:hypothetical protein
MKRVIWGLIALAAGTSALLSITPASALQLSQNAIQVFPAEGNGVCRDYALNSVILQADANPESTPIGTATGPENPQDPDMVGESFDYSYDPTTKVLNITSATTPFDFNAYLYPTGGVTQDFNLVLMDSDNGANLPISSLSVCYGLADLGDDPPPDVLPDCSLEDSPFPNVGVACELVADGTVISYWDPHSDEMNPAFLACVCNSGGEGESVQCSPDSNGDPDVQECFGKSRPIGLPEAPIVLELFGDPIYCSTSGGTRTCQCIDNPFTVVNECAN